jgi:threonyl-tRNA synthetase
MEWVPYVVVIGDDEVAKETLTVTIRSLSKPNKPFKQEISSEDLAVMVTRDLAGRPWRPLYTPRLLSKKARYI